MPKNTFFALYHADNQPSTAVSCRFIRLSRSTLFPDFSCIASAPCRHGWSALCASSVRIACQTRLHRRIGFYDYPRKHHWKCVERRTDLSNGYTIPAIPPCQSKRLLLIFLPVKNNRHNAFFHRVWKHCRAFPGRMHAMEMTEASGTFKMVGLSPRKMHAP